MLCVLRNMRQHRNGEKTLDKSLYLHHREGERRTKVKCVEINKPLRDRRV